MEKLFHMNIRRLFLVTAAVVLLAVAGLARLDRRALWALVVLGPAAQQPEQNIQRVAAGDHRQRRTAPHSRTVTFLEHAGMTGMEFQPLGERPVGLADPVSRPCHPPQVPPAVGPVAVQPDRKPTLLQRLADIQPRQAETQAVVGVVPGGIGLRAGPGRTAIIPGSIGQRITERMIPVTVLM